MRVNSAAGPTRTGRAWGGAGAVCGGVNTRPCTMLVTTAGAEGAVGGWGGVEPVVAGRCAGAHGTSAAWWCTQRRGGRARPHAHRSLSRTKSGRRAPCTRTVSDIVCSTVLHTQRSSALFHLLPPHKPYIFAFPACTKRPHAAGTHTIRRSNPKTPHRRRRIFIGRP